MTVQERLSDSRDGTQRVAGGDTIASIEGGSVNDVIVSSRPGRALVVLVLIAAVVGALASQPWQCARLADRTVGTMEAGAPQSPAFDCATVNLSEARGERQDPRRLDLGEVDVIDRRGSTPLHSERRSPMPRDGSWDLVNVPRLIALLI